MTEAEIIIAGAFLFSLWVCFGALREGNGANLAVIRLFLLGNAAISGFIVLANTSQGLRSFAFNLVLAVGATEIGYWVAVGADKLLGERPEDGGRSWSFRTDPAGCGLTIVVGIALLVVSSFTTGTD